MVHRWLHRWYAWTVTGARAARSEYCWQGMQGAECLFALPCGSPSCFSKPRRASSRTARASKNKNNQSKWTSKDTTRKCLRVAGAGEVVGCWHTWAVPVRRGVCRVRGHGRASRPSRLEIRASGFTVGPGLGPGHPASGAPVDLSSCAPRDRTIALTSWSSRQRTYVRARRPPRGLGLGPGHGSRPSARTRGYRSSLGGHDSVELRHLVDTQS